MKISESLVILKAEADKGSEAIASLSDQLIDLVKVFLDWVKDRKITNKKLEYAFIFESEKPHRTLCRIKILEEENGCELIPDGDSDER